jgi:hypothetical protein
LAELVEFFTKDYAASAVDTIIVSAWLVLALGFPVFLKWDVQDVFRKTQRSR